MGKKIRLTFKTKLLIFEYKERYPTLSPEYISELFNINHLSIVNLFDVGEIIVPSKLNKK
jgi:hypothetical protein